MKRRNIGLTAILSAGAVGVGSCAATLPRTEASLDRFETVSAAGCESVAGGGRATVVILEPERAKRWVCNPARAKVRFAPASTYKIPHTLIALETGVAAGTNIVFSWDGRDRGLAAWNRDLTLRDAVASSAVWVFQRLAFHIGYGAEREWVRRLQYGNQNVGGPSDLRHFWLSGPLAISANEQIEFLQRLAMRRLPASEANSRQTIDSLDVGRTTDGYPIYGKTGAMLPIDDDGFLRQSPEGLLRPNVERTGWFVGWIDRPSARGGPIYFAHNLDLALPDAMNGRTASLYAVLRHNGLPAPK